MVRAQEPGLSAFVGPDTVLLVDTFAAIFPEPDTLLVKSSRAVLLRPVEAQFPDANFLWIPGGKQHGLIRRRGVTKQEQSTEYLAQIRDADIAAARLIKRVVAYNVGEIF